MYVYHVVTDRPMYQGQQILFDEDHHSGVYARVMARREAVEEIYAHPEAYRADTLEHHTSVALRELALEEVRQEKYPQCPSRMGCLYVSATLEEAEQWAAFFVRTGRPTYHIAKLEVGDSCFAADATKCFRGQLSREENRRLAELYWESGMEGAAPAEVREMLVSGSIRVTQIVKEINANIPAAE